MASSIGRSVRSGIRSIRSSTTGRIRPRSAGVAAGPGAGPAVGRLVRACADCSPSPRHGRRRRRRRVVAAAVAGAVDGGRAAASPPRRPPARRRPVAAAVAAVGRVGRSAPPRRRRRPASSSTSPGAVVRPGVYELPGGRAGARRRRRRRRRGAGRRPGGREPRRPAGRRGPGLRAGRRGAAARRRAAGAVAADHRVRARSTSTGRRPSSSTPCPASARPRPQAIVAHREEHGPFASVDALEDVRGHRPGEARRDPGPGDGVSTRVWRAGVRARSGAAQPTRAWPTEYLAISRATAAPSQMPPASQRVRAPEVAPVGHRVARRAAGRDGTDDQPQHGAQGDADRVQRRVRERGADDQQGRRGEHAADQADVAADLAVEQLQREQGDRAPAPTAGSRRGTDRGCGCAAGTSAGLRTRVETWLRARCDEATASPAPGPGILGVGPGRPTGDRSTSCASPSRSPSRSPPGRGSCRSRRERSPRVVRSPRVGVAVAALAAVGVVRADAAWVGPAAERRSARSPGGSPWSPSPTGPPVPIGSCSTSTASATRRGCAGGSTASGSTGGGPATGCSSTGAAGRSRPADERRVAWQHVVGRARRRVVRRRRRRARRRPTASNRVRELIAAGPRVAAGRPGRADARPGHRRRPRRAAGDDRALPGRRPEPSHRGVGTERTRRRCVSQLEEGVDRSADGGVSGVPVRHS